MGVEFADDSFLFFKANETKSIAIQNILARYERDSGQAINTHKSGIFFGRNTLEGVRENISGILGVSTPINTDRYLGLPSLIGETFF